MIDEVLIEKTKDLISDWTSKYPLNKEDLSDNERYASGTSIIPQWQKDMARWCNRHVYYAASKFRDFEIRKGFVCSQHFR